MTTSLRGASFALTHRTTYAFDRPVGLAPHEIRLRPAPHARARVDAYSLAVEPAAHTLHWQQDAYANWVARLTFPQRASALVLRVELAGELVDANPFDFFVDPTAAVFPFSYAAPVQRALGPYLAPQLRDPWVPPHFRAGEVPEARHSRAGEVPEARHSRASGNPQPRHSRASGNPAPSPWDDSTGTRLSAWVDAFRATIAPGEPTVSLLVRVNRHLRDDVDYRIRDEPGVQSADATLAAASGSCRDSAWLLVQVLRHLGVAARFVSGYLVELASDAGTRDSGSLHAWTEAFVPGAGWIGLDPTSGLLAASGHIPLACAADPDMATPVSGTTDVSDVAFDASIDVRSVGAARDTLR